MIPVSTLTDGHRFRWAQVKRQASCSRALTTRSGEPLSTDAATLRLDADDHHCTGRLTKSRLIAAAQRRATPSSLARAGARGAITVNECGPGAAVSGECADV
jgi:hypothetical protein